jgi:chorismate-pyruvate lyase
MVEVLAVKVVGACGFDTAGLRVRVVTTNLTSGVSRQWWPRLALIVSLWVAPLPPGHAQTAPRWPDTFESRLEVLALTQTLNAEILASPSATRSLEKWCRDHKMAADPLIIAHAIPGVDKAPAPEQLRRLQVASGSDVKYRQVELRCGSHVLSEADNWYVPSRLTAEMNNLLDRSETPFGKAVQALRPYRQTFAVTFLWSPLPAGWEQQPRPKGEPGERARPLEVPRELFEHRAILYTSDHQPFSEVHERYQGQLLAFVPGR